ncbi:MAG: hypothetical protein JWQ44_2156 [Chthoniobacter sp.]|nr:hypothetical protein [Chthoniobacter sp.]
MLAEGSFDEFFDRPMRLLLEDGLARCGAHEGTVWLLDRERTSLLPRFNNGPNAASFVGSFRQTLRAGMISMVVATEQPICENEVQRNQQQDKTLDRQLGLATSAMLAIPFYFAGELRGVISAVKLKAPDAAFDPAGFSPDDLRVLQFAASILTRLIEYELLNLALSLDHGA